MALTRPSPARPVDEQKPAPAAVIDLRDIFVILKRQAEWVFWSALICTLMGTIVAFALPTRYTATAQILLDVHGLQVMQGDLTPRVDRASDALLADAESQLQVVSSGSVLMSVVEREKLQDDPEFGAAPLGLLSSLFGSSGQEDRVLKATRILQNRDGHAAARQILRDRHLGVVERPSEGRSPCQCDRDRLPRARTRSENRSKQAHQWNSAIATG